MRDAHGRIALLLAPPLLLVLALAVGQVRRSIRGESRIETRSLVLADGSRVYAELHLPGADAVGGRRRPAVILAHGYLANSGFMRSAWAADVTEQGWIALLLDRRGHGRSDGAWWPPAPDAGAAPAQADLAAAVAMLRQDHRIDPARIALAGHSDGATAALVAASADWDIAATVAAGASVAPWELVSHVAPRSLLLIFGERDTFVLEDSDVLLISSATRGHLDGAGQVGDPADGSGRRLIRIDGVGHVGVGLSEEARVEALAWLGAVFGERAGTPPVPIHMRAEAVGLSSLVLLLATVPLAGGISPRLPAGSKLRGAAALLALAIAWLCGLRAVAWLAAWYPLPLPTQELPGAAWLFVSLAAFGGLSGSASALVAPIRRGTETHCRRGAGRDVLAGATLAGCVLLVLEVLGSRFHDPVWTAQRTTLLGLAAALALPAFLALEWGCVRLGRALRLPRWTPLEAALAASMAAAGWVWFPRMSAVPVYLLAAALLLTAALRAGSPAAGPWLAASFGAVIAARLTSSAFAFH